MSVEPSRGPSLGETDLMVSVVYWNGTLLEISELRPLMLIETFVIPSTAELGVVHTAYRLEGSVASLCVTTSLSVVVVVEVVNVSAY